MSRSEDQYQAQRWLDTARQDLRAAEVLLGAELPAHACFVAQQAGEKAVKGLWRARGEEARGHSIQRLVLHCPQVQALPDRAVWLQTAMQLDRLYIPTRYPYGLPDLTPGQTYVRSDAGQALRQAMWLVERVEQVLAQTDEAA